MGIIELILKNNKQSKMKISAFLIAAVFAKNAEKLASEEENLKIMMDNLLELTQDGTVEKSYADSALKAMKAEETADGFRLQSGRISFSSLSFAIGEVKRINLEAMISVAVGIENMPKLSSQGKDSFQKYGCYCTPHKDAVQNHLWVGQGAPVDEIDALCKDLWDAYKCLPIDEDGCSSTEPYKWKVQKGDIVKCSDKPDTCARTVCETDKDFATEVSKMVGAWKSKFHMDNGFDRVARCTGETEPSFAKKSETGPSIQVEVERAFEKEPVAQKCCGFGTHRHFYKTNRLECCPDGTTK